MSSIIQAFKKLDVSGASEDHGTIYEVSYQYLSKVKNFSDVKSFNNCLVALINMDKYQKGLELIKKVKDEELIEQFSIEVGYIYYKTGQSKLLHELYAKVKSKESSKLLIRGLNHIVAQDLYQRGEYKASLDLYSELIKENDDVDSSLDLITNELAIISQLNFLTNELKAPTATPSELTHDYIFNDALVSLSNGEFNAALDKLNSALNLLDQLGLDPEDYELEKCPILLTKSYILQKQGKPEAKDILDTLHFDDLLISLTIANNSHSFDPPSIFSDRNLKLSQSVSLLRNKLTYSQYSIIVKNNLILKYFTKILNNVDGKTSREFVGKGDYSLLGYKVLLKLGITHEELANAPKSSAKRLFKYINKQEVSESTFKELVAASLVLLTLNMQTESFNQSVIVLQKLVAYNLESQELLPGLIGSLVNLYERLDTGDKLVELYQKLASILDSYSEINFTQLQLFKIIGFKLLVLDNPLSSTIFQKLHLLSPEDQLINDILNGTASAKGSLVDNISDDIIATDIDSLIPRTTKVVSSATGRVEKKRPRKPKFGAGKVVAENFTLDSERWLPLKSRSYYKPKKAKKKSHQGVVETTPTPSPSPAPAPAKNKKKKKKGKK